MYKVVICDDERIIREGLKPGNLVGRLSFS